MKTYYELLELTSEASLDDIKRSFRREIAKYHPDKVQHLGEEFQEIAAVKAAELTQAYKTLSDETLRADYDESLRTGGNADAARHPSGAAATAAQPAVREREGHARPHAARPSHEPLQTPGSV